MLFKAYAENQTGQCISALHDDKDGKYMSKASEEYCIKYGIERQHIMRN